MATNDTAPTAREEAVGKLAAKFDEIYVKHGDLTIAAAIEGAMAVFESENQRLEARIKELEGALRNIANGNYTLRELFSSSEANMKAEARKALSPEERKPLPPENREDNIADTFFTP